MHASERNDKCHKKVLMFFTTRFPRFALFFKQKHEVDAGQVNDRSLIQEERGIFL
jgi:hypothetical protein